MAQMRYYTADLLTNTIMAELPLYGVNMDKSLSAAGNFTGTYQLGVSGSDFDQYLMDGTIPGQQAIFVERNNVVIWAGPIWVRTYQGGSYTVQLQAQTYESVFEHIVMTTDQVYGATDQNTILSTWLTAMMAQTNNGFGLTYSGPGATGVTRSIQFPAAEEHFAIDLLNAIAHGAQGGASNGMDYTVNVASPSSKTFLATYAAAAPTDSGLFFEYPGQIQNFWYSESAQRGAVRSAALGAGLSATGTLSGSGSRPYFWRVEQFSDIADQNLLQQKANELLQMPFISPTFELSDANDFVSGWDKCGQTFSVRVQDPRFPTGNTITSRMLGWSYTPEQSDSDESVQFTLETDT